MAKTATFAVRLDEDLKSEAQNVLEDMGIPMSLAVEMFLRQVVAKKKLPFAIGEEGPTEEELALREERERTFWQSFILWYFKVWPQFYSPDYERMAAEDFGYDGKGAGSVAKAYINGDSDGYPSRMTDEQREASMDCSLLTRLLSEAKELIYWALDMDRVFVPSLSARYGDEVDKWCYRYLKKQHRLRAADDDDDDFDIADGVIGARYFGVPEVDEG